MSLKGKYSKMAENINNISPAVLGKWVISIVIATILTLGWLSQKFVTSAEASDAHKGMIESISELKTMIVKNNEMQEVHSEKHELESVIDQIRENESQTFNLEQFVIVNGSNSQIEERRRGLAAEMDDLQMKKTCILNHNPLCE